MALGNACSLMHRAFTSVGLADAHMGALVGDRRPPRVIAMTLGFTPRADPQSPVDAA